ncbi:MAG: MerR family transcriptional regulator [Coriobacteriales bacterium]
MAKTEGRGSGERLHSMKEACEACGLPYETLKFYCNKGLVPNVKRDANNRRVFSDRDIEWVKGLACLKRCGLSIAEMQEYTQLCLQGPASIPERRELLKAKRALLVQKLAEVQASIDYIDFKQGFYDDVLAGRIEYASNLMPEE